MTSTVTHQIADASEKDKKVLPWNSIKIKLLFSFAVILFLLFIQIIYFSFIHFKIVAQYKEVTDNLVLENSLSSLTPELVQSYLNIINSPKDNTRIDKYYVLHGQIEDVIGKLDIKIVDRDSKVSFKGLKNYITNIITACDDGIKDVKEGALVESINKYDDIIKKSRFINENVSSLIVKELNYSEKLQIEIGKTHIILIKRGITMFTLVILICVLFTVFLSNRIINPLIRLSDIANRITKGNLNIKVDGQLLKKKDETGVLSSSFDNMLKRLHMEIETQKKISADLSKSKMKLEEYSRQLKKENIISIKKEKSKLETLLNDIGEGVMAMNLKGNILIINKEAENMFGKKMKECIGKPYMELFDMINVKGEKVTMDAYPINAAVIKQKTITSKIQFIKNKNESIPFMSSISPVIFQNKIIGIIGIFRDITEEERIDRAKTEFVSLASHQLKTPLTAIRWFLDILGKKNPKKEQLEYITNASISTNRMIKLVGDFLDISRLESGDISVLPQKGDFVEFTKGLVKEASALARKRGQKILMQSKEKAIDASFDSVLISQVILNLLSNAIHYSPEKSIIQLLLAKKGEKIEIKIKDNGFGISKEDQKKLFTKFFRSRKSVEVSTTGSGLGLYIIKKVLDTCKGDIKCKSKEGKGTTFTVIFPLNSITIKGEKRLLKKGIS